MYSLCPLRRRTASPSYRHVASHMPTDFHEQENVIDTSNEKLVQENKDLLLLEGTISDIVLKRKVCKNYSMIYHFYFRSCIYTNKD